MTIFLKFLFFIFFLNCATARNQALPDHKNCNTSNIDSLVANGYNVNEVNPSGTPPISYYARYGAEECIKALIKNKADINKGDDRGWTPLVHAVYSNPQIINLLIDNGADIRKTSKDGGNSLILASELGKIEIVKALIEKGADVNHQTLNKGTPLMHSAIKGHTEVVKTLLLSGANPNIVDFKNISPLMHASFNGSPKIVELLIFYKADVNLKDYAGYSAIMGGSDAYSPNENHLEVIDLLAKAGVDINSKNNNGETALSLAKKRSLAKIIKKLKDVGAKD